MGQSPPINHGWPRMTEAELSVFSPEEQAVLRQAENDIIVPSKLQLEDLNTNCDIKPQYAKTYRVLRRDKRKTLEKMRAQLNAVQSSESDAFLLATMRIYDQVISHKLELMAAFFRRRWDDDIESWAGKEGSGLDRSGCILVVLGFLTFSSALAVTLLALAG